MKNFYKITVFIALLLIGITNLNAQNIDVYVGGTQNDQAAIWKNEVPELLEGWEVNDIEIIGEDIYVAGLNGEGIPVIWKNNEIIYTLDEFTFVARSISSMEIYGDDVYVTTIDVFILIPQNKSRLIILDVELHSLTPHITMKDNCLCAVFVVSED